MAQFAAGSPFGKGKFADQIRTDSGYAGRVDVVAIGKRTGFAPAPVHLFCQALKHGFIEADFHLAGQVLVLELCALV